MQVRMSHLTIKKKKKLVKKRVSLIFQYGKSTPPPLPPLHLLDIYIVQLHPPQYGCLVHAHCERYCKRGGGWGGWRWQAREVVWLAAVESDRYGASTTVATTTTAGTRTSWTYWVCALNRMLQNRVIYLISVSPSAIFMFFFCLNIYRVVNSNDGFFKNAVGLCLNYKNSSFYY